MRLFFAINLPEELKDNLSVLTEKFDNSPLWRPTKKDNRHLTMSFLGEVEGGLLKDIAFAGHKAASFANSPKIELDKIKPTLDLNYEFFRFNVQPITPRRARI